MTTRSGKKYADSEGGSAAMTEEETMTMADMMKFFIEERRLSEARAAEERRQRDEEMQQLLRSVVGGTRRTTGVGEEPERTPRGSSDDVRLTKLSSEDDIEAYLTTFERAMTACEVPRNRWAFRLAPQLTGKAQQAYAGMSLAESSDYDQLKAAILRRYEISSETYRRRFREAGRRESETYRELVTRLQDLSQKWMRGAETVEAVLDKVVMEQFLNSLPKETRVWVSERKPESSIAAGQLADDFALARKSTRDVGKADQQRTEPRKQQGIRQCYSCGQTDHVAKDCPKRTGAEVAQQQHRQPPRQGRQGDRDHIICFNCRGRGHMSRQCPSNALFAARGKSVEQRAKKLEVACIGTVEGHPVDEIVLDTGCSRTLVRKDLVPGEKLTGGEISIRCAHGDIFVYPLADVQIEVGGRQFEVQAGVSEKLPVSVLLGTDVPHLAELLKDRQRDFPNGCSDAMAVQTRAKRREQDQQKADEERRNRESEAQPRPLEMMDNTRTLAAEESQMENPGGLTKQNEEMVGTEFDDDLFQSVKERTRLSRRQKRAQRRQHSEGQPQRSAETVIDLTPLELEELQRDDPTLEMVRKAADGEVSSAGVGFFRREGLIYRRWTPPGRDEGPMSVEQLVLPMKCRRAVLQLAHEIPLSGHLGKTKTSQRILQRFYWPTLYKDVGDFCRACPECQKASTRRPHRVPLVPLPIIGQPFERIAMDIVGPLPRSRNGNRYILVVCDYATRYPEAVPLRTIDAERIAEELVGIFARVGLPGEILTDQGSNFMSQLLKELYKLLHIKPIRTSPYHPQTDGLVERFNQTLKAMLRKSAVEEGKDWDKLLPYLLFAYREVPQASTGFSPFELLYGKPVRGPLDILRESWEAGEKASESVVSHVLSVHEKLSRMTELAQENLENAQRRQKMWYDRNARSREFAPGDQVLVLLPTSTNKLLAEWQGPYSVESRLGKVTYVVNMRSRRRTFHVNMLRKWHQPSESSYLIQESDSNDEGVPTWKDSTQESQPSISNHLSESQRADLQRLLTEYADILVCEPGRTNLAEHDIITDSAQPVKQAPYRLPHAYRSLVKADLEDMQRSGIIEPSTSEWASPIVLVKKKDGTMRMCVDFRRLNAVSRADAYPMPRIDEMIDRLGTSKYITTLDLTRGYWQVPVKPDARPKTAFTTPFGLFQFRVMPFGLHGAPATFQRMMDKLLRGLEEFSAAYIDDLIIFSSNWEEHLQQIRTVFGRLRAAGLTVKPAKCQFGMSECIYLGHVVGNGVIRPDPEKLAAVKMFPTPTTKKQVRAFLGLTGYYRKFIPKYAAIATPLTDLTRKNAPTQAPWDAECDRAFNRLKEILCGDPVLRSPDFEKQFVVQTDASNRGVAAVLSQRDDKGEDHPVAFFSRKLLPREVQYSTIEKECLAIKLGVQAFRVYLIGRPFVIQTDHRSLTWLDKLKDNNARLTRWSLFLQPYNYTVEHRAGKANGNADALSRAYAET